MIIDVYHKNVIKQEREGIKYLYQIGSDPDTLLADITLECYDVTCILDIKIYKGCREALEQLKEALDEILEEVIIGRFNYPNIVIYTRKPEFIKRLTREYKDYKLIPVHNEDGVHVFVANLLKGN